MFGKVFKRLIIWGLAMFFGVAQDALPPEVATLTIGAMLEGAANYVKIRFGGE